MTKTILREEYLEFMFWHLLEIMDGFITYTAAHHWRHIKEIAKFVTNFTQFVITPKHYDKYLMYFRSILHCYFFYFLFYFPNSILSFISLAKIIYFSLLLLRDQ